jgi:hypothetical protein
MKIRQVDSMISRSSPNIGNLGSKVDQIAQYVKALLKFAQF